MTDIPTPNPGPPRPMPPPMPGHSPVREPDPKRLPDEEPLPNPDENDEPPMHASCWHPQFRARQSESRCAASPVARGFMNSAEICGNSSLSFRSMR